MATKRKPDTNSNISKTLIKKRDRGQRQRGEIVGGPIQPDDQRNVGIVHLIECNCILPQYMNVKRPVFHKFPVFSIIDVNDNVKEKIVQCNNCGIVHRITDICKSEVVYGKDELRTAITIDDVKFSLKMRSPEIVELLEANNCTLPTWEQVKFIFDEEQWGSHVVISVDNVDDRRVGKYIAIMGPRQFGIGQFNEDVAYGTF